MTTWEKKSSTKLLGQQPRSQIDRDELLKTLGSQFNVDFADYDKWRRKAKVMRPPPPPRDGGSRFTVNRVKSAESIHPSGKGPGHVPTYREKKEAAKKLEQDKERNERMKILELRIRTRKKTLEEYRRRSHELLSANIELRKDIEGDEYGTLNEVKSLLRRYEKYRGGITTLNTNFTKEYEAAITELKKAEERTKLVLRGLEEKVVTLDVALKEKQDELQMLMSYKDKEYPVKAMKIATLQKEIQNLRVANQEDQEDLEHIVYTELAKFEKEQSRSTNIITKDVTEKAISMMHPSLKDMALQNMVMMKEIEIHKKEHDEIKKVNEGLEMEVKKLLQDPRTNTRLQMFPEFFPSQEKCTPDMEVILDIPTQQWLPI